MRFAWSAPDCPGAIATLDAAPHRAVRSWRLDGAQPAPDGGPWAAAHLETFRGPAGPVEAVVLGDWRRAPHVVVALHGGPEEHWDLDFQPLLQLLARRGWAVVAPNPRGSTGYGAAHAAAIQDAWGGPDADDVAAVGATVRAGRAARATLPALVGVSYGAFLALLTAAREPGCWSRVAAVSPFLSGARLHAEAGADVRALIDRLGGRSAGSADVAIVADRLRGPVLVVHGTADPIVPVGQARRLRALLGATELDYHEVAGVGHDPLADPIAADVLVRFLDRRRAVLTDSATVRSR